MKPIPNPELEPGTYDGLEAASREEAVRQLRDARKAMGKMAQQIGRLRKDRGQLADAIDADVDARIADAEAGSADGRIGPTDIIGCYRDAVRALRKPVA